MGIAGPDSPVGGAGRRRSSVGLLDEADEERARLFTGEQSRSLAADPKLLPGTDRGGGTPRPPKRQQDLE